MQVSPLVFEMLDCLRCKQLRVEVYSQMIECALKMISLHCSFLNRRFYSSIGTRNLLAFVKSLYRTDPPRSARIRCPQKRGEFLVPVRKKLEVLVKLRALLARDDWKERL